MDKAEFRELVIQELKESGPYCCYCCEPKSGYSCCGENHFVPFTDLYEDDKKAMIEEQMFEFDEVSK